ncbi:MAG: hypothetical protein GX577_01800 [Leptolinea sp.]|nr:hypothetical protein [Leptolinea sp.]
MRHLQLSLLLIFLLSACTSTSTAILPQLPAAQPTLTDIPLPTPTITPKPTADLNMLSASCLDTQAANAIVEGWLLRAGYATLRDAWLAFMEATGEGDILTSSTTDYDNLIAYAVTWRKMLLLGEYPFRVQIGDRQGIGYCSVLIYHGGMGPEVGMGITDVALAGEWSGYASGLVATEEDARAFLANRVGMPVTVRYMVAQNPQDIGFVRPGFFSPVMQQLWSGSYFTRIPEEMSLLTNLVGQPRGPSIQEMMQVAGSIEGHGVFLEYIVDMIPQR